MLVSTRAVAVAAALGLLGTAALAGPAAAATKVGTISDGLTEVTLLNFNDFHGRIDNGLDLTGALGRNFACTIQTARGTYGADSTLLLSAGDNVGASSFASNITEDFPTIEYLDALGLASSAVGNHEFDRGFGWLTGEAIPLADFPYLGANVYRTGTTTPALDEFSLHEVNGVTVGVIGVVTDETPSLVTPAGVAGLDFGDAVDAVNRVAAQLSDGNEANGEADVIVAEYHDGAATAAGLDAAVAATTSFERIANDTSADVDVIFNGHTHLAYQFDGVTTSGTRVISQSGSYGDRLGVIQLGVDADGDVVEYAASQLTTLTSSDACVGDPVYDAAAAIVTETVADAKVIGLQPIGEISADITTAFRDAAVVEGEYTGTLRDDRLRESTLGNLVAGVWLWAMNQPGRSGADIGIQNPGGLRGELFYEESGTEGDGVVTYAEAAGVNPFANTLQTIDITGEQFRAVLEQQWQPAGASRPFLKLGLSDNVRYTYDPDATEGNRILDIWLDGEPMDPAGVYTVVAGNFLIGGGDNFTALRGGTNLRDSGQIDTDAFINYFAATDVVEPSYEKNGVAVTEGSTTVTRGVETTLRVEGVDLTSLGSPANTEFAVMVDGFQVGTAAITTTRVAGLPTRDGVADLVFTINPLYLADTVQLVAEPSGTVVTLDLAALPVKRFRDVAPSNPFYTEITWLGSTGISTGWENAEFRPYKSIDRDAMAAFLYRMAGEPAFDAPEVSPFSDVSTDNIYYTEITWLHATGISTGWEDGTFRPWDPIDRDAMAAFLYRLAGEPAFTPPAVSPFTDVTPTTQFYKEISWLAEVGISTGWDDGTFRPWDPVKRDAMAAFLYRFADHLGLPQVD